jgi:hypothetical protein
MIADAQGRHRSVAPLRSGFHPLQVTLRNHPAMKMNYRRRYFGATTFGE